LPIELIHADKIDLNNGSSSGLFRLIRQIRVPLRSKQLGGGGAEKVAA
jgi:hypothetical protein